jgi:hypothetical protein
MNKSARRMTFCATCVVAKMVATHFLNPIVGCASGTRGCMGCGDAFTSSTCLSVVELSNQNRHVTWNVSLGNPSCVHGTHLCRQLWQALLWCTDG